jgi:hypothetical protein
MSAKPCRWFKWIGQPLMSCDDCGKPAWEHDGMERMKADKGPFDPDLWVGVTWEPEEAEAIRRKWGRHV